MRRLSIGGLLLCLPYLALTMLCVWIANTGADPKGRFVMLQLPLTPQYELLRGFGSTHILSELSWAGAYALLFPPMLAALYLLGYCIQVLIERPSVDL
ncbi:hypothetical protein ACFFJ4_11020 [Xanthomonas dyei]|uniref:Uncharacterized protein n=1 Tax=Xanthomonas dyei TaxID=743699 RepID=A0A2S7C257_9XANT|nr:hypothetical protein [Xanthomonas dyei]MCC4633825.1 hypothetical protein [Xanthomonas dyei pv. eucalypti]PPU55663.1 hypothetical protein XdyCFBP7245_12890 [Xanthomonas dyei]WOB27188.1 hypothetical protein NYR99_04255 [Xanthomonas dyei]WOB54810.1 hypothetical protein NYR95_04260 [Xanthomonas dyei]